MSEKSKDWSVNISSVRGKFCHWDDLNIVTQKEADVTNLACVIHGKNTGQSYKRAGKLYGLIRKRAAQIKEEPAIIYNIVYSLLTKGVYNYKQISSIIKTGIALWPM